MDFIKIAFITLLAGVTIFASVATFSKTGVQGVQTVKYPHGISLRQASVQIGRAGFLRRTGFFRQQDQRRFHRSGGLSRGK